MRLHPKTTVTNVTLTAQNLERALVFYRDVLGMHFQQANGRVDLSTAHSQASIVTLVENPAAGPSQRTTGLYHLAILVPSRYELARTLHHLVETGWQLQGAADHLVSEALYMADAEGNGVEIYCDRPPEEWPFDGDRLKMATDPLDVQGVMNELVGRNLEPWTGLHPATRLGHIHLRVSDLLQAEQFYVETLGFDLMVRYGTQASFVSAGGYHHHLGMNTWGTLDAPPPPANAIGLRHFTIAVPSSDDLATLQENLAAQEITFELSEKGLLVRDPSQNSVLLTVRIL